jgi:hypothetical protein
MAFLSFLAGIALLIVIWAIGRQAAKAEPTKLKRVVVGLGLVLLAVALGFVLLRTPLGAAIGGIAGLAALHGGARPHAGPAFHGDNAVPHPHPRS